MEIMLLNLPLKKITKKALENFMQRSSLCFQFSGQSQNYIYLKINYNQENNLTEFSF